jgi:hypothetical protein
MGLFKKLFGLEEAESTPKRDAKGDLTLLTVYKEFDDEDDDSLNKHFDYEDDLWQFNNIGESQVFSRDIALEEGIPLYHLTEFPCFFVYDYRSGKLDYSTPLYIAKDKQSMIDFLKDY